MDNLKNVRDHQQGKTSEAEKIYSDETIGEYFKNIQLLRVERDLKIQEKIQEITEEYDSKIKEYESKHGLLLVMTKD